MEPRRLNTDEQVSVSRKLMELKELHEKSVDRNPKGFEYDWQQLSKSLDDAIKQYRQILRVNSIIQ